MVKSVKNIVIISYVLSVLYLVSVFIHISTISFAPFRLHAVVLALIFLALFLLCFFVAQIKEWARQVFVGLNALLLVYSIVLLKYFPDFIEPTYVLMNLIVVLFFNQATVKFQFNPVWKRPRKSVLVVDDDEGLQKTLQRILLTNGYSVLIAATGERGLQVAKLQKPDLVILDVILPGIKGRDVCARLKENHDTKNIPVIFLTAKDSPDDIKAEMAAGATTHLTKPVNAKELLAAVKSIVGS